MVFVETNYNRSIRSSSPRVSLFLRSILYVFVGSSFYFLLPVGWDGLSLSHTGVSS